MDFKVQSDSRKKNYSTSCYIWQEWLKLGTSTGREGKFGMREALSLAVYITQNGPSKWHIDMNKARLNEIRVLGLIIER